MRSTEQLVNDARFYLSRRLTRSLAPPDRVSVNLTLRCNLSCTMCTTCYDAPELSTAEVKSIIDQTATWGVEVFNPLGGEPFMRGDIEEILGYAVRRGFYVTVTTNGTLITEKRAAAIATIPSDRLHFNISLDGDQEANDLVRSSGAWKRAIAGYRRIREADAVAGNSRRKILANTILHRHDLPRFEAVLDEQAALGFDGVQVLNLFRAGDDPPPEAAALWFGVDDMPALAQLCERLARRAETQGPAGYRIDNRPDDLRAIPDYYRHRLEPLSAPCWAGWKELYINADGAAIMCDGSLDFLAGHFGSVREQTLRELWRSPALRERRTVVKQCTTPCVQDCYLRRDSDSGRTLALDAARLVTRTVARRAARLRPRVEHHTHAVLRLELSDICDCSWEGCRTPTTRFADLTASLPGPPSAEHWAEWRDAGLLDFGRGFMGFEVVRSVVSDLRDARLRFGTLAVRWRGEPLLHPEAEPILRFLLDAVDRGLADRLRVETSGRFLTSDLATLADHDAAQEWVLDLDRGGGAGLDLLTGRRARLVLASSAAEHSDPASLVARFPGFEPAAGRFPGDGDRLWFRRTDHLNYRYNAAACAQLARIAEALGVDADLGEEDQPRRCPAPRLAPTVSWDGKVTLCPADVRLENRVGEVTSSRLSAMWRGPELDAARRAVDATGVPDRALCRDCAMPWSPNLP